MTRIYRMIAAVLPALFHWAGMYAQPVTTRTATAAEIRLRMKHLDVLGSVLYIAAHPDDENTRMLAYLALEKGYETAYMSLTRGDGGQNLIGSEQGTELGLIRTQELLAARHLDGAKQYFSSAYDFGFSKNPEETFTVWNREKVLGEIVWVIRTTKPDVIITRFTPEPSATHGHHTASAQLALEAFDAAADPQKYPEQLALTGTWRAKRIFWNTSWFFYGTRDFDKTGLLKVDVGAYIPQLGQSVGERAAESRSQHRSQGFGSARQRGEDPEYLKLLGGEPATADIMDGVVTGWKRVKGAETVEKLIQKTVAGYSVDHPETAITGLLEIRRALKKLPPSYWTGLKLKETEYLLTQCAGFYGEALLASPMLIKGDSLRFNVEVLVRNPCAVKLGKISVAGQTKDVQAVLKTNVPLVTPWNGLLPETAPGHPFWLREPKSKGMFSAGPPEEAVRAYNPPPVPLSAELFFGDDPVPVQVELPLVYKYTEPDRGELFSYPEVVPALSVNATEPVLIVKTGGTGKASFRIVSHGKGLKKGRLVFRTVGDIQTAVPFLPFEIGGKNAELVLEVPVTAGSFGGAILPELQWENNSSDRSYKRISYAHIPNLVLQPKAELRVQPVAVRTTPMRIGYVKGAGDEVPGILRQLGYIVEEIEDGQLQAGYLQKYAVVVTGIRAYNTRDALAVKNTELTAYVNNGGRLIVQYNTSNGLVTENIGPYPFKLTRNRITVEEAPLTLLQPAHALFQNPNVITAADFDGWVQERGLYFTGDADPAYQRLLKGNDPNEAETDGILLYATYGKGQFIYTGLSFFRQLPAGNPGAIRLFVNLLEAK